MSCVAVAMALAKHVLAQSRRVGLVSSLRRVETEESSSVEEAAAYQTRQAAGQR